MEKDFREFVDSRVNNNLQEFKKENTWNIAHKAFYDKYNQLYNILPEKQKEILEEIQALFYNLTSEEQYIVYKIGFCDGTFLKSDLEKVARI